MGTHLSKAFSAAGHKIVVYTRHDASHLLNDVSGLVWTNNLKNFRRGFDFIIITVNDNQINQVCSELETEEGIVLHTSGSTEMNVLGKLKDYGVFYPLQSFRKNRKLNYPEIPVFVEANTIENLRKIKILASGIFGSVVEMTSNQRMKLHLGAVVVNNFSNHLYTLSRDFLDRNDIQFSYLFPLIGETATRLKDQEPRDLQTGPARRNDNKVIEEHLAMLSENPDLLEIYKQLTSSIKKWHRE